MYLKKLTRNISLSFVFIILGAFLAYLFRRYLALNLSVADYGLLFSIIAFFSLLMLFIDLGLEPSVSKAIVELRLKKNFAAIRSLLLSVLGCQLLLSFIVYIIVYLLAPSIANNYFHVSDAVSFIRIMGLWFLFTPISIFLASTLLGFERTTLYTALDFFRMLILILITWILFSFGKGIYAPLFAYAVINIALFCIYIPYIFSFFRQLFCFSFDLDIVLLKKVFSYGLIMAFTSFGWIFITQTDTLVLTYMTSLENVGLYNIAMPIALLLLFFIRPVSIVFYPFVTELAAQKKHEKLGEAINIVYQYLFILLLPAALATIVFSKEIIQILFSIDYVGAYSALIILSIGTMFYGFSMFNNVIFNGLGKAKYMAYLVCAVAIFNIVFNIILIPKMGINGAAISTSISYIILFILSSVYLNSQINFKFPLFSWIGALLSAGITVFIVIIIKNYLSWNNILEAIICGVVLMLCYVGLLFVFKVVNFRKFYQLLSKALSS